MASIVTFYKGDEDGDFVLVDYPDADLDDGDGDWLFVNQGVGYEKDKTSENLLNDNLPDPCDHVVPHHIVVEEPPAGDLYQDEEQSTLLKVNLLEASLEDDLGTQNEAVYKNLNERCLDVLDETKDFEDTYDDYWSRYFVWPEDVGYDFEDVLYDPAENVYSGVTCQAFDICVNDTSLVRHKKNGMMGNRLRKNAYCKMGWYWELRNPALPY